MGGFDEHLGIMGEWMLPNPSPTPRTFFASLLGEDIGLRSLTEHAETDNKSGLEQPNATVNTDENVGDQIATSNALTEQKMSSGGSLVDRMAARAGFNAPRINTETIRSSDLMQTQEVRSPYLTIPSGLSPTSLLDSPVFLSNSLAQPSPTTGKYVFGSSSGLGAPDVNVDNCLEGINTSFTFKPVEESRPSLFMGETSRPIFSGLPQQTFTNTEIAVDSEKSGLPFVSPCVGLSQHENNQQTDLSISTSMKDTGCRNPSSSHTISSAEQSPLDDQQDEDVEQRAIADYCVGSGSGSGPAEDGYNWRKYGQKQVKGSEYPRSYYKCTHPNCPVKKKVERSHEGHITEIIYTGAHNHPKPPPSRRSALGSSISLNDIELDNTQNGNCSPSLDWRHDNFEVTSSANLALEYGNCDRSSALSIDEDDEEDDRNTSLGQHGQGEESESKRRKVEMSGASRAIREPRVVVQTTSEVDILDDGYRWRKYGQKVVKGNPNPRSYYKCTSAGCTVRKHVERASNDLKSVITTYEGKHNHDVPAARNSTHITQVTSSAVHRPEPSQIHNNMRPFQRPSFSLPWTSQLALSHGLGVAINHQGLTNFSMPGMGQGEGIFNGHPHRMDDMAGFMLPRGEPKLEPIYEPELDSTSSSAYHHLISRLPRGPQM